jgi:hypothetical protein
VNCLSASSKGNQKRLFCDLRFMREVNGVYSTFSNKKINSVETTQTRPTDDLQLEGNTGTTTPDKR